MGKAFKKIGKKWYLSGENSLMVRQVSGHVRSFIKNSIMHRVFDKQSIIQCALPAVMKLPYFCIARS
jgi:hypothetical protein